MTEPYETRATVLATALLDAIVAGYESYGVELPARRFLAPGLPAWDCEEVAVWIERIFQHQGDVNIETNTVSAAHPALMMQGAMMRVLVTRCTPMMYDDGSPPPTSESTAAALSIYADQMLVRNSIIDAYNRGELAGCSGLSIVEWVAAADSGGMGGGVTGVRLSLV